MDLPVSQLDAVRIQMRVLIDQQMPVGNYVLEAVPRARKGVTLEGDTLTCPWHGFQYIVTDGHLLVDENAHLDSYRVELRNGEIHLFIPDFTAVPESHKLRENEFRTTEVAAGQN